MTFNANIPQASDIISNSQAQLLANFQQLNTQFGVDHNAFNTGSGNGNGHHKLINFDQAASAPSPTGTESGLYPFSVGGLIQLLFKNASKTYQLTGLTITTSGSNNGLTTPWGIILNWGTMTPSSGGTAVTFAVPFTSSAYVFCQAQSTSTANTANIITPSNVSTTGFNAYSSGSPSSYYFAIGV